MIIIKIKDFKKSITLKFFVPIFSLLFIGCSIIMFIISAAIEREVVEYVAQNNINKAEHLVKNLEENYLNDLENFKANNYDKTIYENVVEELKGFKNNEFLYVYLTYLDNEGMYRYLVDADYPLDEMSEDVEYSNLFDEVEDINYIPKVYETGEPGNFSTISKDEVWGETISAYLPIKNSLGEVKFVLGVDSDLNVIDSLKTRVMRNFAFCMVVLMVLFTIMIAYSFKGINDKIKKIGNYMESVGNNDLSRKLKIKGEDELDRLGQLSYKSISTLSVILKSIRSLVKNASNKIVNTNERMDEFSESYKMIQEAVNSTSDRIEDITASSEEIVASTQEISSQISNINSSCYSLSKNIEEITSSNAEGTNAVRELNATIDYTQEHIKSSLINNINYISDSMMTIVPTIMSVTDIAAQINLLSLNASIEAARAGKSGAGFSVIAEEIRRLSTETDMIAKEIISNINKLNSDIIATQEGTRIVEDNLNKQQDKAVFVDEKFSNIYETLNQFAKTFESFQSQVDFIDGAKESLLSAVQNISATSEETYGSTEEIRDIIATKEGEITSIKQSLMGLNEEMKSLANEVSEFKTE